VSADVAAVVEGVAAESSGSHLNSVLATGVKPVHFQFALNHLCTFFG
jgi:hypothetical protein